MYIPPPPHATTYHHHWPPPHSASCPGASAVFAPVDEWKSTTSASCRGWCHHVCKWTICASGWMKKHHERKLQLVETTTCASGMFAPVERRETPQAQDPKVRMLGAKVRSQGAKVTASISASRYGMQQQHEQPPPPPTMQIWPAQHDAAITATCVRLGPPFNLLT